MKRTQSALALPLLALAACGPSLWVPGGTVSVRATAHASVAPPSGGVSVTTSNVEATAPQLVTVEMGNDARGAVSSVAPNGWIDDSHPLPASAIDPNAVAQVHVIAHADVAIEGASNLAAPNAIAIASTDLPSDAVVVGGTLDLGGGIRVVVRANGAIAGGGAIQVRGRRGGRAIVVSANGPSTRAIVGGSLVLEAPDGRQWTVDVDGGDIDLVTLARARTQGRIEARVHARLTRSSRRAGTATAVAVNANPIDTDAHVTVNVSAGHHVDVIGGAGLLAPGAIVLTNSDIPSDAVVVGGSILLGASIVAHAGGPATRVIAGGTLTVAAPDGRQWAIDVTDGDVDAVRVGAHVNAPVTARIRVGATRVLRDAASAVAASDPNAGVNVTVSVAGNSGLGLIGGDDLVAPDAIVLATGEIPSDAVVVGGTIHLGDEIAAHGNAPATRLVAGGTLTLRAPDGRQWTVDVAAGDLDAVHVHAHARGRITARIRIRGAHLAGGGATAVASNGNANGAAARRRRPLTARERLALQTLVRVSSSAGPQDARGLDAAAHVIEEEATDDATPMFYRIPIVGHRLVIAVDVSYSMRDTDPNVHTFDGSTPSKLDMLRAQLAKLLGALPPDIAIDIVAFSSDVQVLWDAPRVLDERSLIEAVEWVARLRPMDETRPLAAVQRAIGMQSDQVIMLTDGRPTYADSEEPALMRVAGGLQASIRLDVVGIGPDQNAAFLDALAQRGHGIALHF
jgi:hypothetical protein